jgi:hypothetical protein
MDPRDGVFLFPALGGSEVDRVTEHRNSLLYNL